MRGIAVDWVSQNLYVADAGYHTISQISYKEGNLGHNQDIVTTNLVTPGGIVTHPRHG